MRLAEGISRPHVLSIPYSGGLRQISDGGMDLYSITESLLSNLLRKKTGQDYPLMPVGHSIGGLVIAHCIIIGFSLDYADVVGPDASRRGREEGGGGLRVGIGLTQENARHHHKGLARLAMVKPLTPSLLCGSPPTSPSGLSMA